MKQYLLFLVCSVMYGIVLGQAPTVVNDPAMLKATTTSWALQLEKAAQQIKEVQEQSKFLQEGIDRYKKVNAHIKNAKQVHDLLEKQVKIISNIADEMKIANENVVNDKAYAAYKNKLLSLSKTSKSTTETLTSIISDNTLQMTDYERLKMIEELNERSNNTLKAIQIESRRYKKLNGQLTEIKRLMNK